MLATLTLLCDAAASSLRYTGASPARLTRLSLWHDNRGPREPWEGEEDGAPSPLSAHLALPLEDAVEVSRKETGVEWRMA